MTALEVLKLVLAANAKVETSIIVDNLELEVILQLEGIVLILVTEDDKFRVMW